MKQQRLCFASVKLLRGWKGSMAENQFIQREKGKGEAL